MDDDTGKEARDAPSHRDGRARLLPNLSLLALLDLTMVILPRLAILASILMIFTLFYLGYIVLVTRDILRDAGKLHPIDRSLCRWSGPLAAAIGSGLVVLVGFVGTEVPVKETWIGSRSGLFTIKYAMEVGFVFSIACWFVPGELRHVPPIFAWRVLVTPLLAIYGMYIVLLPLSQYFGACDRESDQVAWSSRSGNSPEQIWQSFSEGETEHKQTSTRTA